MTSSIRNVEVLDYDNYDEILGTDDNNNEEAAEIKMAA